MGATSTTINKRHHSAGRGSRWLIGAISVTSLAATTLLATPAQATSPTSVCRAGSHPAAAKEIVARSEAALATVTGNLSWMQADFDQATTASPAAWRLREELDQLHAEASHLNQLRHAAFIRNDATPGSAAQFRAQEEVDLICTSGSETSQSVATQPSVRSRPGRRGTSSTFNCPHPRADEYVRCGPALASREVDVTPSRLAMDLTAGTATISMPLLGGLVAGIGDDQGG